MQSCKGLTSLPPELARSRVLNSHEAAALVNMSLPHWRRLYRMGKVPKPMLVGARKLGWRTGDLVDWLAARAEKAAA
jgi:predicted DNA-binding transcriptional regulator AlpA